MSTLSTMLMRLEQIEIPIRKEMRKAQIISDLARIETSIREGLLKFRNADFEGGKYIGRHETQLKAVDLILRGVIEDFRKRAKALDPAVESNELYGKCRGLSEAIVWLERLWHFFRSKFEQRLNGQDEELLLKAADEVVWSCYRPVIKNLPAGHFAVKRAAAPLPYIEPEYSPAAVQFDRPLPQGLRLTSGDPTLDRCLEHLPLATLRLPPWCVGAPWWLVLVGHEVGHHVQHELDLVSRFAAGLGEAARSAGLSEADILIWKRWGEEIFADAFSVFTMGSWAPRAIAEIEWGPRAELARRRTQYPSVIIRLELMKQLAMRLKLDTTCLVEPPNLPEMQMGDPTLKQDCAAVEKVVDFILQPLPDELGTMGDLCGFARSDFDSDSEVEIWSEAFLGRGKLSPERHLTSARKMASAAFAAWAWIGTENGEGPSTDVQAQFPGLAMAAIRECSEPGMRAGGNKMNDEAAGKIALEILATAFDGRPNQTE